MEGAGRSLGLLSTAFVGHAREIERLRRQQRALKRRIAAAESELSSLTRELAGEASEKEETQSPEEAAADLRREYWRMERQKERALLQQQEMELERDKALDWLAQMAPKIQDHCTRLEPVAAEGTLLSEEIDALLLLIAEIEAELQK